MNDQNDTNDWNQSQSAPETPPSSEPAASGFCQNCGKPLTTATARKVGAAVYCESCLAARLGATSAGVGGGYRPVNTGPAYGSDEWLTQRLTGSRPNPGLAALLGLIPGVGAMYNEQYAKGIIHLLVFAVLVSLSDNVSGIFGLFVAGWVFYMAIEAHHTARARLEGTPLPNPFGLNDIGERLGFGRAWPAGPTVADVAADAAAAASATAASFNTRTPPVYATHVPPVAEHWGAPTDASTQPFVAAAYQQAYRDSGFAGPPPQPAVPYTPVAPSPVAGAYQPVTPFDPATFAAVQPSRFPAGAVWLIGLGVLFLLTTTGIFSSVRPEFLIGAVLLGLGVWVFIRRMMETGNSFQYDGSASYPLRLIRALRVSVYLDLVGTLFLLDSFHLLTWHYSWPFLIILPGVMAIAERFAYQSAASPFPAAGTTGQPVPSTPSGNKPQGGN